MVEPHIYEVDVKHVHHDAVTSSEPWYQINGVGEFDVFTRSPKFLMLSQTLTVMGRRQMITSFIGSFRPSNHYDLHWRVHSAGQVTVRPLLWLPTCFTPTMPHPTRSSLSCLAYSSKSYSMVSASNIQRLKKPPNRFCRGPSASYFHKEKTCFLALVATGGYQITVFGCFSFMGLLTSLLPWNY